MGEVELTQLRYFVAVAEELNFKWAAERCRVALPALSRRRAGIHPCGYLGAAATDRTGRGSAS
jgi:DNA-binding transcriptional LysR family regulator